MTDFTPYISAVADFPKPGVLFRDVSPLLADPEALAEAINVMAEGWDWSQVDRVGGFDARGFLFGVLLAQLAGKPFFPIRKAGKLPGPVETLAYDLEYGSAKLEIQSAAIAKGDRVLLVDDLLATGGTAAAGAELVLRLGGVVAGLQFVVELTDLPGRSRLSGYNIKSLTSY
jgi:adenine phosphoribosyltransferase